jgi:Peptidase C10 family.
MKKILGSLMVALSVISCQEDLELNSESGLSNETPTENSYQISADSALANLNTFLTDTENYATKTVKSRTVSSITPIKFNSTLTRAVNENLKCENLLYVANFENEQGYAILAGDTRIEEKVIAVADDGQLTDVTVYTAVELANAERIIIDEYPTTGAGFFKTPETGDELFMNPNTVSLYDETKNDSFVGNFSLDDIGAEDENGNPIEPSQVNTELSSTPELVTSSLCVSYALNEIRRFEKREYFEPVQDDMIIDGGGSSAGVSSTTRTETSTSAWSVKNIVSPILNKYVRWNQQSPFNDLYPKKRKFIIVGNKRKAPAGCFPLAIAKILTHFEYPNRYTYNGYTVNWTELKNSYYSTVGKQSAAHLLKGISSGCGSWYFYNGTFTFPSNVTSYMRFIGLNNAHSYNYSFDRVTEMIDKGSPLIIYSVPGINVFKSHSWNIDGYKIKERTITTKTYKGYTLQNTTTKTETCKMVHCDFGWGGKSNGYYVSGVFKLNDSNIEHDLGANQGGDTNYNNLLKIITYEKP